MIAVSETVNHTVNHTSPFFALKVGGDCVDNGFIFFFGVSSWSRINCLLIPVK